VDVLARTPLSGVLTVARAGLDEATRNRTVLVVLVVLLGALAVQPYLALGSLGQPLRYKIQFYLSFSGFASAFLLGGVTIFLAASAVATDLEGRRASDVFVKPIPRWAYLLGRWLGVALPMAVLVAVWAAVTAGVAMFWLAPQPAQNAADRDFVNNRVLVARQEVPASPVIAFEQRVSDRFEQVRREDPERLTRQGQAGLMNDLLNELQNEFLSVRPGLGRGSTYRFAGLGAARERAEAIEAELQADAEAIAGRLNELGYENDDGTPIRPGQVALDTVLPFADELGLDLEPGRLQLRFKVRGTNTYGGKEGTLLLDLEGVRVPLTYVVDRVQVFDLPATVVDEQGELELGITNLGISDQGRRRPDTIQFETDAWLSVFFVKGDVPGNFLRQGIVLWVRLAFLAMLATAAASLMSFPVAATLTLAVWVLAAGGSYVRSTLASGVGRDETLATTFFETTLLNAARGLAGLLSRFSEVDGTGRIASGLYVPWQAVGGHVLWVGLVWTAIAFLIGWALFSRREIARVQV